MDVVIGIAMTSRDARLLLVEGSHGDGAVIDHDSFDADTVVNAVLDTHADAPANGYTVTRVALTWTDEVDAEAKLVLGALEEQGIAAVVVVSETDAETVVGEANSVTARPVVPGDDEALLLARGALLASADIRGEAAAPKHDPLMRTLAMIVTTAVLIVAGSAFLAITVHRNDDSPPSQASASAQHSAPAPPPVHTVVRKVVPLAGRAAQRSLAAPYADTVVPPSTGVVRR